MKTTEKTFFGILFIVVIGSFINVSFAQQGLITGTDVALAKTVIKKNTMTIPGFGFGSQVKISSGKFSAADALVLYMLKFHQKYKICPPMQVVADALQRLDDTELNKKAVAIFWLDYSTTWLDYSTKSDADSDLEKNSFLEDSFEWYILTKQTEKLKISNARLQGFVGSDEAWRKAMDSQQKYWQKSTQRNDEYLLKRDAYRTTLNAERAVWEAERAVIGP